MPSRPLVIVPTFNEAQNLRPLVEAIEKFSLGSAIDLLIVDDASPDGTGALAEELSQARLWMHVVHRRRKDGLGPAYRDGFSWGAKQGYPWLIQMDADLSHPPFYLKTMLSLIQNNGHDVFIGSRYCEGGGIQNWGAVRRWISRWGNRYATGVLGVPIADLTGGFNAWRTPVLDAIGLDRITSDGYAFQIELKHRAYKNRFKIHEFPIVFEERRAGRSKMSKRIILEAFINVLRFRFSG